MKIVALISGGKDSCFNALHCVANGHDVVALANLHPPAAAASDELDSHMYQTVGHTAIPHYAACFRHPDEAAYGSNPCDAPDLPMFRRPITGASTNLGMTYSKDDKAAADEVEDLYELLADVMRAMPQVTGVSVGAILSSYQRVRVENVCQRLGLTVYAYLWDRDQVALLDSMVQSEINAVFVKVAAMGLNGRHLGKSLAQLQPHIMKLYNQFGLHPCGEGGEYETLTLDCPLFRRRLVLEETQHIEHAPDDVAPVVFLQLNSARVQDKGDMPATYEAVREAARRLLVEPLERADLHTIIPLPAAALDPSGAALVPSALEMPPSAPTVAVHRVGELVAIGSVRPDPEACGSLEEAAKSVLDKASAALKEHGLSLARDGILITVLVQNMADFARVNAIYGSYLAVNPPARACVQAVLPVPIQIDVLARATVATPRSALHIQSVSYWAPANIGPYSQSVTAVGHSAIAGQIGLVPRSMSWPEGNSDAECALRQACLARRHLERIARAVKVQPVAVVAYVSDARWVAIARQVWFARFTAPPTDPLADENENAEGDSSDDDEDEHDGRPMCQMLDVVVVPTLPRDGAVEYVTVAARAIDWHPAYLESVARIGQPLDSDVEADAAMLSANAAQYDATVGSASASRRGVVAVVSAPWITTSAAVEGLGRVQSDLRSAISAIRASWNDILLARVFYLADPRVASREDLDRIEHGMSQALGTTTIATSFVPVKSLENGASALVFLHLNVPSSP
ncbi:hypothetical protein BC828DRAFT_403344 [Blastocladiella britannica]|nr:hypothetical protein BC828DRAFT_403344 [Blastocladiella britannica]